MLARIGLTRRAGPAGPQSVPRSHQCRLCVQAGTFKRRVLVLCQHPSGVQTTAPHPRRLLLMRCAAARCWHLYGEPASYHRRFETREGGRDRDTTVQPTPPAGLQDPSGNMLLLLESTPLLSDPGPCPCLSGFLFDTKSSNRMNSTVSSTVRPLAVAVMWLPCLQPGSTAHQVDTSTWRQIGLDEGPPETAGPSSSACFEAGLEWSLFAVAEIGGQVAW